MLEFFREGGFGMFPVLAFGVLMIAGAARYAVDLSAARLRYVIGVGMAVAVAVGSSLFTNVAMVFFYLEDRARVPDSEFSRILVTGLKEATRPAALGGFLMMIAVVIVCVGLHRAAQREAPRA